jgi:antagonist of KipI
MLQVIDAGFLVTVQDLGRVGLQRLGVPVSGAMDRFALTAANRLVGNPVVAAGLECFSEGPLLVGEEDLLVAGAGRGYTLVAGTCSFPLWMAVYVPRGEVFGLRGTGTSCWGYLAISGGLATPQILGSRSTYLRAGIGGLEGRTLQFGDRLPMGEFQRAQPLSSLAGRALPKSSLLPYANEISLHLVLVDPPGPFDPASLPALFGNEYLVRSDSDRMGYRLGGPQVAAEDGREPLTEGAVPGVIQVPGDGQPLVLMCDAQTTGGYRKAGTVTGVDMPLLAQCPPGVGRVRFRQITLEEAVNAYRRQAQLLASDFWED